MWKHHVTPERLAWAGYQLTQTVQQKGTKIEEVFHVLNLMLKFKVTLTPQIIKKYQNPEPERANQLTFGVCFLLRFEL